MVRQRVISPQGFDDGEWPDIVIDYKRCGLVERHDAHQWVDEKWIDFWCEGGSFTKPRRLQRRMI